MKNLANILTVSRIILAVILLLFFKKISVLFIIVYTIAEITDMVDGTIARKTNSCSQRGAVLDSIADLLLDASIIKMVFAHKIMSKELTIWLAFCLIIGALSPIISFFKHKKVFFIHSISCKIFVGIILIAPFAIYFGFFDIYIPFALTLLTICMLEIMLMSIFLKEPNPNATTLYSVIKQNKALKV